jgi:hypothetical protein
VDIMVVQVKVCGSESRDVRAKQCKLSFSPGRLPTLVLCMWLANLLATVILCSSTLWL